MSLSAKISGISLNIRPEKKDDIIYFERVFNMKEVSSLGDRVVISRNACSKCLKIELIADSSIKAIGDKFTGDGFVGLGFKSTDAKSLVALSESYGGVTKVPLDTYSFGASIIPDEDEMKQFPVKYCKVKEPTAGYTFEIFEDQKYGGLTNPISKVIMNCIDLEESSDFYEGVLGMKMFRRRSNINSNPKEASISQFYSFAENENEDNETMLELVYPYSTESIDMGKSFRHLALDMTADKLAEVKGKLNGVQFTECDDGVELVDPNGYTVYLRKIETL